MTTENLFDDRIEDTKDYLNELVGEGKKFNTVEALARGKAESDTFIKKLQDELAEARTEVQKRIALEELKTAILERNGNSNNQDSGQPPVKDENTNLDSIEETVNKALETRDRLSKAAANEAIVTDKIKEVWGDNAQSELRKAAQSLGMSPSELGELGRKNPNALFKLIGVNNPTSPSGAQVPTGTVRLGNDSNVRDNSYYSKLRRENPKLYYDKHTQVQMHKDAMSLRERFFNS